MESAGSTLSRRTGVRQRPRFRAYLERNPIAAWAGGQGKRGQVYFRSEEGVFSTAFEVPEELRADLSELVGELVEWRLAAYLGRQQ